MIIKDAQFTGSYPKESMCPADGKPEFAFIGRSNVGKSSLINMLTHRKSLAKVSVTPGKTRLLNFFDINDEWYLVDLPGYGYARVSRSERAAFEKMIHGYLKNRQTLVAAFVLLDSRHDLQKADEEFLDWCGENQIPILLVFTKIDKLKKSQLDDHIDAIKKPLLAKWSQLPDSFMTSSETKTGREDILNYIENILENIKNS